MKHVLIYKKYIKIRKNTKKLRMMVAVLQICPKKHVFEKICSKLSRFPRFNRVVCLKRSENCQNRWFYNFLWCSIGVPSDKTEPKKVQKKWKKQFFRNKRLKVLFKSNSDAIFGIYVKFGSPPVFFKKM